MAKYFTGFENDTLGGLPSGWTKRWDSSVVSTVKEFGGSRVLEFAAGGSSGWDLLSYDAPNADAARDEVDVLIRIYIDGFGSGSGQFVVGAAARCSGNLANRTGHVGGVEIISGNTKGTNRRFVSGGITVLGSSGGAINIDTWYWMRFNLSGDNQRLKYWTGEYEDQPGTWAVETTNSDVDDAGWIGVANFKPNVVSYIDRFAVGTNGDEAPHINPVPLRTTAPEITSLTATDWSGVVSAYDSQGNGTVVVEWELRSFDDDSVFESGSTTSGGTVGGSGTYAGWYYLWCRGSNDGGYDEDQDGVSAEVEAGGGGSEPIEASPQPIQLSVGTSSPAASVSYTAAPEPIQSALGLSSPGISVGYTAEPDAVASTVQVSQPEVGVGYTAEPEPIVASVGVSSPVVAFILPGQVQPLPIQSSVGVSSPDVDFAITAEVDTVQMGVGVSAPSVVFNAAEIEASAIQMAVGLSSPSVSFSSPPIEGVATYAYQAGGDTYIFQTAGN